MKGEIMENAKRLFIALIDLFSNIFFTSIPLGLVAIPLWNWIIAPHFHLAPLNIFVGIASVFIIRLITSVSYTLVEEDDPNSIEGN